MINYSALPPTNTFQKVRWKRALPIKKVQDMTGVNRGSIQSIEGQGPSKSGVRNVLALTDFFDICPYKAAQELCGVFFDSGFQTQDYEIKPTLGETVKAFLTENKVSQRELGRRMQVTEPTVIRIVRNGYPTFENGMLLARELRLDPYKLFYVPRIAKDLKDV